VVAVVIVLGCAVAGVATIRTPSAPIRDHQPGGEATPGRVTTP